MMNIGILRVRHNISFGLGKQEVPLIEIRH